MPVIHAHVNMFVTVVMIVVVFVVSGNSRASGSTDSATDDSAIPATHFITYCGANSATNTAAYGGIQGGIIGTDVECCTGKDKPGK